MSVRPHLVKAPHYVYRCYGPTGELLYVGCTVDVDARLGSHRSSAAWWARVARTKAFGPIPAHEAEWREALAIRYEQPIFNVRPEYLSTLSGHRLGLEFRASLPPLAVTR